MAEYWSQWRGSLHACASGRLTDGFGQRPGVPGQQPVGHGFQQIWHRTAGHRLTEQITLDFDAAGQGHGVELLRRLHALGRGCHAKLIAQAGHGADDGMAIGFPAHIPHERLVDLDAVEREAR